MLLQASGPWLRVGYPQLWSVSVIKHIAWHLTLVLCGLISVLHPRSLRRRVIGIGFRDAVPEHEPGSMPCRALSLLLRVPRAMLR